MQACLHGIVPIVSKQGSSFRLLCYSSYLGLVTYVKLSVDRSSNRDPGTKAADALSQKDHEGMLSSIQINNTVCSLCCFLLLLFADLRVLMHYPVADWSISVSSPWKTCSYTCTVCYFFR